MREFNFYIPSKIKIGKKHYTINAQILYSGIHHRVRMEIIEQIKDLLIKQIIMNKYNNPIEVYPLCIEYSISANKKIYDLDNISYIIIKIINDTFVKMRIINDDNIKYINKIIVNGTKDNKIDKNYLMVNVKINNH